MPPVKKGLDCNPPTALGPATIPNHTGRLLGLVYNEGRVS